MNILLIHNKYAHYGGEDAIVEQQKNIFEQKGNKVFLYIKESVKITEYSKINKLTLIKKAYKNKNVEKEVEDIIKNFKPHIAHVHNVYPLISPYIYEILYENNIPIAQTLHNYRFICANGLMFNKNKICEECLKNKNYYFCAYNKCYRDSYFQSLWYADVINNACKNGYFNKINKFIALNQFVKNKMIERGFEEEKICIIPNCTNLVNKEPNLNNKEDYYLYIGRLSEEKGTITLIKAFEKLKDINLKIVGGGPLEEEITNEINEKNLLNINLLGFKQGKEKEKIISKAKAIIVPSEWYENFPTVILEAFSLGTMVIASDIGGLSYMIEDNVNGIKFEMGNYKDLINKINYLEQNKDIIVEFSKNAYSTSQNDYSVENYYLRHENLYKQLIKL